MSIEKKSSLVTIVSLDAETDWEIINGGIKSQQSFKTQRRGTKCVNTNPPV
jgi:hypothetical protein